MLCDIDKVIEIIYTGIESISNNFIKDVIEVSKKFLPTISCGFNDPRVKINIGDGLTYLKDNIDHFDVIITDSCDNSSKAASPLFGEEYFKAAKESLKEDGYVFNSASTTHKY